MKHGHRILIGTLAVVALAAALALMIPWGQDSLAQGDIIYVDADAATGSNDGGTWEDAYTTLQPALDAAGVGDQIWVAEGTYKPTVAVGGTEDRYKTFQMVAGVAIYGGFDPTVGDDAWEERDWLANPTILSGDLDGNDGPDFANNDENSYHVFYHPEGTALDATAILDGFTVTGGNADDQSSHYMGGGIYNDESSPALSNCIFSGNVATYGGGMFNMHSSPMLDNCAFEGNYGAGGGLHNAYSSPTLINCTFWGNSGAFGGGMANYYSSSPTLTNCTFAGNAVSNWGGALYNYDASAPTLTNCILWGDTPEEIYNSEASDPSAPVVTYSDIQGGYTGTGNINTDPLFVDAANGDYHLRAYSPCTDAGNNDAPNLPDVDFEGDARILDADGDGTATVDMGVDEVSEEAPLPPDVIYVDQDAEGAATGMSWDDAFTTLQSALAWAVDGVEIWVAEGTYTPTAQHGGNGARYRSFQMVNGVAIYGGFAGTESSLEERDWEAHETILSGDLDGDDGPDFANNDENSYHVFYHPDGTDLDSTAILDGFAISDGNANSDDSHSRGGGMYNYGSDPALSNCTFAGNSGGLGGGLHNDASSPVLTNVTFDGNSAGYQGGGMFNTWSSSPALTDCTFSGNSADQGHGGGMYNTWSSSPTLTGCAFAGNYADEGGGMVNWYSSPTLTNCIFAGNSADYEGGMYNAGSSPVLTNCIFTGNSAGENCGGMRNDASSPVLTNVTFEGNSAIWYGGGMCNDYSSSPALANVAFYRNSAGYDGGGMINWESSPVLINCTFSGNSSRFWSGGGMYNSSSSPVLTNVTFEGNSAGDNGAGGGVYNSDSSAPTLTNCILWGDTPEEIYNSDTGSSPIVTYSDIQGGYSGVANIDADPLFVDAANDDFHLGPASPCVDVGSNMALHLPEFDFEGHTRVVDGDRDGTATVDMGADEVLLRVYLPLVLRGY